MTQEEDLQIEGWLSLYLSEDTRGLASQIGSNSHLIKPLLNQIYVTGGNLLLKRKSIMISPKNKNVDIIPYLKHFYWLEEIIISDDTDISELILPKSSNIFRLFTYTKPINFKFLKNSNISKLQLSDCNLTSIPEEIYHIPYLKDLMLNNNNIKTIPDLTRLNLEYLNMSFNKISQPPFYAKHNLKKIKVNLFAKNPFSTNADEKTIKFLRDIYKRKEQYL